MDANNGDPLKMADWIDAVSAERAPPPEPTTDWSRRTLTMVIVAVALITPFYSYAVVSYLQRREANAAIEAMNEAIDNMSRPERRQTPLPTRRQRAVPVRVVGAIDGAEPTVVAEMGDKSPSEARVTLCKQASQWLKRDLVGQRLRVQMRRGNSPAENAGVIWCD